MEKSPTFNANVFNIFRKDEDVDVAARINRIVENPNFITKASYLEMLQRLSGENDIQFLEDIAFANKKESEQEIVLDFRIWPENDREELFNPFSNILPNARWKPKNLPSEPWFNVFDGNKFKGKAKYFCVVLLFIRRILSSDVKLMFRVWLDQLPYRLIPLKELKESLRKVSSTESDQEVLKIIDSPPLLKQLSQQEREEDEAKQEKYAINIGKGNMTGFAKQIVDQLARRDDGMYIDVSSGEKYEKYNDKIYIGGRKYYFQTWAEDQLILEKYSNTLMQQGQSFVVDSGLNVGFDDEIKLIIKSIDEIEGNNAYKEESFLKSVNHIIDNNVDTYADVKIYHFGRITSKRDTDTIEGMNKDNIWGYGSLLFALRDYNFRSLSQEIADKNPNLEKFNSDWASFIPGRNKDKTAKDYQDYLRMMHNKVSDAVLIILDYFLQFRKTVDTETFAVAKSTKYDGQVVSETTGFDIPNDDFLSEPWADDSDDEVKQDETVSKRAYTSKTKPRMITEYRAHVMNPLFDVTNNKEKMNPKLGVHFSTTPEVEWVKDVARQIKETEFKEVDKDGNIQMQKGIEEEVAFFLLGYATIGDQNYGNYQKTREPGKNTGEEPIYRSRLTKDGKDSKFTYTLYEGFLVNAYEQYKILEDIFYKLKDSAREDGKLTNRVVHYAKDSRNYKPYHAYIHKDESKLTLKNGNESIEVFKMELYQQRLHGVAFDDPDQTLEKSKTIDKFDNLDDFWFMFSHLRRCTIYWYRVYSNLLALLYALQDYDDVIDKYLEKYIYDNLEEGLLTKKEKRYTQNRNRFNINMTQEVYMDKVANIVQPLASTINDSYEQIQKDIEDLTKIVLVKQGTVDGAMEKLDWLRKQKELYDENQKQKEDTRQEQLKMEFTQDSSDSGELVGEKTITEVLNGWRKEDYSVELLFNILVTIDMDQANDTKRIPIRPETEGTELLMQFTIIEVKKGVKTPAYKINDTPIQIRSNMNKEQVADLVLGLLPERQRKGKITSIVVEKNNINRRR